MYYSGLLISLKKDLTSGGIELKSSLLAVCNADHSVIQDGLQLIKISTNEMSPCPPHGWRPCQMAAVLQNFANVFFSNVFRFFSGRRRNLLKRSIIYKLSRSLMRLDLPAGTMERSQKRFQTVSCNPICPITSLIGDSTRIAANCNFLGGIDELIFGQHLFLLFSYSFGWLYGYGALLLWNIAHLRPGVDMFMSFLIWFRPAAVVKWAFYELLHDPMNIQLGLHQFFPFLLFFFFFFFFFSFFCFSTKIYTIIHVLYAGPHVFNSRLLLSFLTIFPSVGWKVATAVDAGHVTPAGVAQHRSCSIFIHFACPASNQYLDRSQRLAFIVALMSHISSKASHFGVDRLIMPIELSQIRHFLWSSRREYFPNFQFSPEIYFGIGFWNSDHVRSFD